MKKYISNFHYLTQDINTLSHLQLAQMACEAGLKWIQYRSFNPSIQEKIKEINQIAEICDDWGSSLIICQDIELAEHAKDYQGLHIENPETLSIEKARETIGADRVLGLSCPDIKKIVQLKNSGIDYFSIGPYGKTTSIQTEYPILKSNGLIDSMKLINHLSPNFNIPIIISGGIFLTDIPDIFKSGVYGLAISSAINLSENPKLAMKVFYKEILESYKK